MAAHLTEFCSGEMWICMELPTHQRVARSVPHVGVLEFPHPSTSLEQKLWPTLAAPD